MSIFIKFIENISMKCGIPVLENVIDKKNNFKREKLCVI